MSIWSVLKFVRGSTGDSLKTAPFSRAARPEASSDKILSERKQQLSARRERAHDEFDKLLESFASATSTFLSSVSDVIDPNIFREKVIGFLILKRDRCAFNYYQLDILPVASRDEIEDQLADIRKTIDPPLADFEFEQFKRSFLKKYSRDLDTRMGKLHVEVQTTLASTEAALGSMARVLDETARSLPEIQTSIKKRIEELKTAQDTLVQLRKQFRSAADRQYRRLNPIGQIEIEVREIVGSVNTFFNSVNSFGQGLCSVIEQLRSPDALQAYEARALYEEERAIKREIDEEVERVRKKEAEEQARRNTLDQSITLFHTVQAGVSADEIPQGRKQLWTQISRFSGDEIAAALERLVRNQVITDSDSHTYRSLFAAAKYPEEPSRDSAIEVVQIPPETDDQDTVELKRLALERLGLGSELARLCAVDFSINEIDRLERFVNGTPVSPDHITLLVREDPSWTSSVERLMSGIRGLIPLAQLMHRQNVQVAGVDSLESVRSMVLGAEETHQKFERIETSEERPVSLGEDLYKFVVGLIEEEAKQNQLDPKMCADLLCFGFRYRGCLHSDTAKISEESVLENVVHYSSHEGDYRTNSDVKKLRAQLKRLGQLGIVFTDRGYGLFRNTSQIKLPTFQEAVSHIMVVHRAMDFSIR